jgi:acetyl esterase/lipase
LEGGTRVKQETTPEEIAKKKVVHRIPGMDEVKVTRDVGYQTTDGGALTMDIYYPPDAQSGARLPAVVFVAGYPDPGLEKMLGCKFKEMGAYVSWGRLTAASGMVAITYTNREPAADVQALLRYVRQHATALGVDERRIGLWACSGNVPLALSMLMNEASLKCAVLCYGLMLDLEGATHVAEAAKTWGFANPCAGKSIADLPRGVPLFVARAGQDQMPHLNETIDDFMAAALAQNLPVTFVNHPTAPHAFDLFDDSEASREIIRRILAFMRFHLLGAP